MTTPGVVHLTKIESSEAVYKRKTVTLPTYEVWLNGETVGFVRRAMITHERRIPGMRYVNARWQSPGWCYGVGKLERREAQSRRDGIERLLLNRGVQFLEAEKLAAAAKTLR